MKRKANDSADDGEDGGESKKPRTVASETDTKNFLRFYTSLAEEEADQIRFFQRKANEQFTVYGEKAALIGDEYFKTNKVIKQWKDKNGPQYVDIKHSQFPEICRHLIDIKKMRVEIYMTDDSSVWRLMKSGSPGNIADLGDVLFDGVDIMQEKSTMAAVTIAHLSAGQRVIGVAFAEVALKEIGVIQMPDNEQLSNLEALFYQIGVKEVLCVPLDPKDKDLKKLYDLIERMDLKATTKKRTDFKVGDIEQDLQRLLGKRYLSSIFKLDDKHAMAATSCLISSLGLLGNESNYGNYVLKSVDLDRYLRLDSAAINALNILPNPREPNQKQNLFGLLNRCKTPMGTRLLNQWLKQPLKELEPLQERLDILEVFFDDEQLTTVVRSECFKRIPDLERVAKKLQTEKATLQDCVIIYQFIQKLPLFVKAFDKCEHKHANLVNKKFKARMETMIQDLKQFEALVEETIDLDAVQRGEFLISPEFDEVLQELAKEKKSIMEKIDQHEDDVKTMIGAPSSFKLEFDKNVGYHFKITRKDSKCLEGKNKTKFSIILSSANAIKFRDSEMEKLSNFVLKLSDKYDVKSRELVKEIMKIAGSYLPVIEDAHELLAVIDVHSTLGEVSRNAKGSAWVKPTLTRSGQGDIVLVEARHPVLEAQPDVAFIPNSIELVREKSSFQIITGPNMGGKSTYIRSVGVIVLMAQIGCFVPCTEARISLCDSILARVGASDSQLRGVSTFMAEMLETATILNSATSKSLIIIDELGRGTSTYDGFGLAWAISEHICKEIGAFCLFATHFHELTQLEEQIPCVKNYHVVAHADEEGKALTLLYEVKPGPSDQSFGIHVAKLAEFPDEVIQIAKAKAAELENFDSARGDPMDTEGFAPEEVAEAQKIIRESLADFTKQPVDKWTTQQAAAYLTQARSKLSNVKNSYLQKLIADVASS